MWKKLKWLYHFTLFIGLYEHSSCYTLRQVFAIIIFCFVLFYKSLNNYREVSYHDFNLHFSNN